MRRTIIETYSQRRDKIFNLQSNFVRIFNRCKYTYQRKARVANWYAMFNRISLKLIIKCICIILARKQWKQWNLCDYNSLFSRFSNKNSFKSQFCVKILNFLAWNCKILKKLSMHEKCNITPREGSIIEKQKREMIAINL